MKGLHLTADLQGCRCPIARLTDEQALLAELVAAVDACSLQVVGQLAHTFAETPEGPGGVTCTVLLAESHVCVHTWPERKQVTLDVYVCHFSADRSQNAHALMHRLLDWFRPGAQKLHVLTRGETAPVPALLLAAGRGERMRPLTDTCPKPLLAVHGQPLLVWLMQALLQSGTRQVVVNTAWLSQKITSFFEPYRLNGNAFKLSDSSANEPFMLTFSDEQADFGAALETAGGAARALPRLFPAGPADAVDNQRVFWVAAGDVFMPDFRFPADAVARFRSGTALAHLWLVPNPPHNPKGDFGIGSDGLALNVAPDDTRTPRYTYSTVGLYRAELFSPPWCDIPAGNPSGIRAPLAPLLRRAMDAGRITAELYHGRWTDVGTPERLAELNAAPPSHPPGD